MSAVISWVMAHGLEVIGALTLLLNALIAVFTLIPGDAPEKQLKAFTAFIEKFSKK